MRSELSVPATNRRMVEKAVASDADLIFLDLEDAVAPTETDAARAQLIAALTELDFGDKLRGYRINPVDSPLCYRDVIEILEAGTPVDLIVVPKVNDAAAIAFLD